MKDTDMRSPEGFLQSQMEENEYLANQAERMRLIVTTCNLCLATVLQIIITILKPGRQSLPLTAWMLLIGVYGIFALKKLYERENYHRARVRKLRARLDSFYPDAQRERLFQEVEVAHKHVYPRMRRIRLNSLWTALHALIAGAGVVFGLLCLFR